LRDYETGLIICIACGKGRMHDFRLFKQSCLPWRKSQLWLADKGYQGIQNRQSNGCIPIKKRRRVVLTEAERLHNRLLARLRVRIEHTIRRFKIFRIFSGRYGNRRRRFGLRFHLIAGILNYELNLIA
jgi:hypothetical protein